MHNYRMFYLTGGGNFRTRAIFPYLFLILISAWSPSGGLKIYNNCCTLGKEEKRGQRDIPNGGGAAGMNYSNKTRAWKCNVRFL